ncbi:MAG: pyridoxal phosphate-dependent aminotransferase [Rhizobiales bacterium]|nr:pyridoxal phosphate-dependent aminotransferase [Hyphomicrobiales bacterium]
MSFDPARLLSPRTALADEGAIIRMAQKSRDLRAKGRDVVSLTVGEPDFDTPAFIQHAATKAMAEGFTHYSPVAGIPELRVGIAQKLETENGIPMKPEGVVLANGAKQAVANAILSLVDQGDEVILLAPYWVSYEVTARFANGSPVVLKAGIEENYKVPAARIAAALTPRSKLLVLNSPCNPTGAVWSKQELEEIADVVKSHPQLMVLADEIYEYILFDGTMHSIAALPGMAERTVTINGFSKGFAMTGWRLGYSACVEPLAKAMMRMQSTISTGANQFVQRAALAALAAPRTEVEEMRKRYQIRRDMVLKAFAGMNSVALGPIPGTFYAFPDVSHLYGRKAGIDTAEQLCDWLLEEHGVATVPGSAFGAPESIRLSFAAGETELEKALERIKAAFAKL